MPNHWHLVLWPTGDGDLSEFLRWLTVTHTQRWHARHHTSGTGPDRRQLSFLFSDSYLSPRRSLVLSFALATMASDN